MVTRESDIDAAVAALGGYSQKLYAEQWSPFVKELAVMVVRSRDGSTLSYPVGEQRGLAPEEEVADDPASCDGLLRSVTGRS